MTGRTAWTPQPARPAWGLPNRRGALIRPALGPEPVAAVLTRLGHLLRTRAGLVAAIMRARRLLGSPVPGSGPPLSREPVRDRLVLGQSPRFRLPRVRAAARIRPYLRPGLHAARLPAVDP
ncbi:MULTISPECIES: hypothetical protein [Actinoalloteichus]|uniref:hypothetical protein n=1 Tax=Actinoalloteichus TaxID=65496 RepID=UPI0012FCB1A4|nr:MULTISPECIES: hypothetical protein [Actinoalloteichus]